MLKNNNLMIIIIKITPNRLRFSDFILGAILNACVTIASLLIKQLCSLT